MVPGVSSRRFTTLAKEAFEGAKKSTEMRQGMRYYSGLRMETKGKGDHEGRFQVNKRRVRGSTTPFLEKVESRRHANRRPLCFDQPRARCQRDRHRQDRLPYAVVAGEGVGAGSEGGPSALDLRRRWRRSRPPRRRWPLRWPSSALPSVSAVTSRASPTSSVGLAPVVRGVQPRSRPPPSP